MSKNDKSKDARKQYLYEQFENNPKYMLLGKNVRKVEVDDRFSSMFHSEKFKDAGQKKASKKNIEMLKLYNKEYEFQDKSEESDNDSVKSSSNDYEDGILPLH
jgi:hypothetical protein